MQRNGAYDKVSQIEVYLSKTNTETSQNIQKKPKDQEND
jgi:hypothetical protein